MGGGDIGDEQVFFVRQEGIEPGAGGLAGLRFFDLILAHQIGQNTQDKMNAVLLDPFIGRGDRLERAAAERMVGLGEQTRP